MYRISLIIIALLFSVSADGQNREALYYSGEVYDAFLEAKKSEKLLLIEFYAGWNYKSRWTNQNVVADSTVQVFLAKYFLVVKIDTETEEGASFATRYQVRDYPSFIVFNSAGSVTDKIEVTLDRMDFIARLEQLVVESDGKSGWELKNIFVAADSENYPQVNLLTESYLKRIGIQKAITPFHWELFSNRAVTRYGSATFYMMLEHRSDFDAAYGRIQAGEILERALFDNIMPYLAGTTLYNQSQLERFLEAAKQAETSYTETFVDLVNLVTYREQRQIDKFLIQTERLILNMKERLTYKLIMSMEFIAKEGTQEQKIHAHKIIERYGRQDCSLSELTLIEELDRLLMK